VLGEIEHLPFVEMVQCHIESAPTENGPVRQFEPPLGHQEKRGARIKVGGLTGRLETLRSYRSKAIFAGTHDLLSPTPPNGTCSRTNGSKFLAKI
jgi:hypothetical protein